jgi:hypothetical protein
VAAFVFPPVSRLVVRGAVIEGYELAAFPLISEFLRAFYQRISLIALEISFGVLVRFIVLLHVEDINVELLASTS